MLGRHEHAQNVLGGAGIGGGAMGASENITISGGVVTATGGKDGAGIGGGYQSTGSNIVISGGSVKTSAGLNGNAIGGGSDRAAVVPTDGNGNNVYPLEIENTKGANIVIDGVDYPDAHDTENAIRIGVEAIKRLILADKAKS